MTLKNIFSMEPGECKVAEKLMSLDWFKKYDCQVAFPVKDVGIDLFVVRGDRKEVVSIQVKESRDYKSGNKEARPYHSWHQINKKDFEKKPATRIPDFYVFVYYKEVSVGKRIGFKEIYIIVPFSDISLNIKNKMSTMKSKKYNFYFYYDAQNQKVEEYRSVPSIVDYTKYNNGWDLIKSALGIP